MRTEGNKVEDYHKNVKKATKGHEIKMRTVLRVRRTLNGTAEDVWLGIRLGWRIEINNSVIEIAWILNPLRSNSRVIRFGSVERVSPRLKLERADYLKYLDDRYR